MRIRAPGCEFNANLSDYYVEFARYFKIECDEIDGAIVAS